MRSDVLLLPEYEKIWEIAQSSFRIVPMPRLLVNCELSLLSNRSNESQRANQAPRQSLVGEELS
jgi:hypothetical protein